MINHFDRNVFINCPFDHEYRLLLIPILFTLRYCKLVPRIASERLDSSEIRLDKIIEIILESKYSIHDLSRIKSSKKGEYYRLNMPLEIGLDLGCKKFHPDEKYRGKKSLILEGERYSTNKGLSDLSGADVKCHENDAEKVIECVRTWMVEVGRHYVPGPNMIWDDYNIFYAVLSDEFLKRGFKQSQIDTLSIPEYLKFLDEWLPKKSKLAKAY